MAEISPRWTHIVQIWWAFLWRQAAIVLTVGFTLSLLVSVFGAAAGFGYHSLDRFMNLVFLIVGLFASIGALSAIFSIEWNGFRIALVPVEEVPSTVQQGAPDDRSGENA